MSSRVIAAAAAAAVAAVLAGCGGASDSHGGPDAGPAPGKASTTLSLVAYSTPQVVYDEVIPAFQRTEAGRGVAFKTSYGASGDQSRAVAAGLKADVVTFSLAPDMTRLVDAGLVARGWAGGPADGLVSTSVVTFIVRKGNPKKIRTWDDLLRPGVQVLTPNPFTSGAAKWNLLAAYAAKSGGGKDAAAGVDYLRRLLTEHVKVQDKSGREALQSFTSGIGDVLLSYENEAITARRKGQDVDYVIPDQTIRIENPIAVTEKAPPAAQAFVDYARSPAAQEVFAKWGYRPVDAAVLAEHSSEFPKPRRLFTIADLGGWPKIDRELFDASSGSVAKIEAELGVPTSR